MQRFALLLLAVLLALVAGWGAALVLLNTSPAWLTHSPYGERAYEVLVTIGYAGLRGWPVVAGLIVLLVACLIWQRKGKGGGRRSPAGCRGMGG